MAAVWSSDGDYMRYLACYVLGLILLAGCSSMKIDSACTYQRTVTTSYVCPVDGKVEHLRVAPGHAPD